MVKRPQTHPTSNPKAVALMCVALSLGLAALFTFFSAQAGSNPSLPDPIKGVHPTPDASSPDVDFAYPPWWGKAPETPHLVACKSPGTCVRCHKENETMDPSHAVACTMCHGGDAKAEEKEKAHQSLIPDPGDLDAAEKTCGKCHPEEARRVRRSAMALAPRMINHTRYAFGAQKTPEVGFLTRPMDGIPQIPSYADSQSLGDDVLRRSCLRCHLFTSGSSRAGELRGKGCSACHTAYPNTAVNKKGRHFIVRDAGATVCLKCHNSNHVGADFVGLFEKDYHRGFRSPFVNGRLAPTIYGCEQHRLSSDVHFRAGMTCSDCHTLDEIHGSGEVQRAPTSGITISCAGCHVAADHPGVIRGSDGQTRLLKGDRIVPPWDADAIPHKVSAHRNRLRCSACHAAWSFQDYGLHLMLEERSDYWKWAPTAAQNDPQVQELLTSAVGTAAELLPPASGNVAPAPQERWPLPETKDWLNGAKRPGAWFRGFSYRRWSSPPLGRDAKGMISVMRPMYQYVVSHVDAEDNLLVDRWVPRAGSGQLAFFFNPYTPHTTARHGRQCQDCHGNPKAAGLGEGLLGLDENVFVPLTRKETRLPGVSIQWDAMATLNGEILQGSSVPGAGPLDHATVRKLLHHSPRHKAAWYRYLKQTIGRP